MKEKVELDISGDGLTDVVITNICAELYCRNWSMKMLADRADLPYESVKKLIGRKINKPSFVSIWKIANAFGCSLDKLAGREDQASAVLQQVSQNTSKIYRILNDMDQLSQFVRQ